MMDFVKEVTLCEVGPRDGLQNEKKIFTVEEKVELINASAKAGFPVIEVGSFVSPKAIPQLNEQDYKLEVISDFVDVPGCGVEVKIGGSPVILATDDYLTARGVAVPEAEE